MKKSGTDKLTHIHFIDQKEEYTTNAAETSVENSSETVNETGYGSDTSSFE